MICPNCKQENIENTKWCCYCGALLGKAGVRPPHAAPVPRPAEASRAQTRPTYDSNPPRRKKLSPVFLWFPVILSLLVIGIFICAVFIPSFSDTLMGMLPSGEKGGTTALTAPVEERRANEPDPYSLPAESTATPAPTPQQQSTPQPAGQSGTVIPIESGVQYAANSFLSNFSEQHAFERNGFDADRYDARELSAFAYLHCVIKRHDALSVERVRLPSEETEHSYFTFTLDTVNDILYRHFGITLRDDELRQQSWNEQFFYVEGKFYIIASSGEAYNRLTVVRQLEQLPDGNFRLYFDIYGEDISLYRQANDAVDNTYYSFTSSAAEADPNFTREASGTAIVRPYVHEGVPTMQLIRYSVD